MPRSKQKKLGIVYPDQQNYSCRDCPARCCSSPWGIPVTPEEQQRILGDDDARFRLNERAEAVLRAGILPMRESERKLVCVFLDDDLLCSLHKKHGHSFIPAPCQAYPFGFSQNEKQQPVALLSRYCPSIRDNYGEPVAPVLEEKLEQAGGARELAPKMGLRSGRVLTQKHFAALVEEWRSVLEEGVSVADALVRIYELTDAFDEQLPRKQLDSGEFEQALAAAQASPRRPVLARKLGFNARVLFSYFLGGLSYPTRVLMPHRAHRVDFWERVRALGTRIRWFLGRGRVDLYLVEQPVPLARVGGVRSALLEANGQLIGDYLREVLQRRQGMSRQTYLLRVVVDLGLMALLISRHARASAAAAGLGEATSAQVKEGIGIAELLFSHQSEAAQTSVLQSLRLKLMSDPEDFRRLLGGEL